MALGARIRQFRADRKWTLEDLSERSGVEVGTISALENRDSERSKFAPKLALAFGCSLEQLLGTEPSGATYATATSGEPLRAREPDGLERLSPAERDIVLAYRFLLRQADKDQFRELIMAKAEEDRGIAAEVLNRYGANGVAEKARVNAALPVRPDGTQLDTIPGDLGPPVEPSPTTKPKNGNETPTKP